MRLRTRSPSEAVPWWQIAGPAVLATLVCGLYLPYLDNPLVFDDRIFFAGDHFAYYATHLLGDLPRTPAYFTLAVAQVHSGRIDVHRWMSLAFHVAVMWAVYRLTYDVLRAALRDRTASSPLSLDPTAAVCAMAGAGAFALHPAAVYGAGYLVQRSVVLATLFGTLSLCLLLHALVRNRYGSTLAAAALYAMAVLSKEHAVPVAAAALPLALLAGTRLREAWRHLALYWLACAPAALFVASLAWQVVAQPYEPLLAEVRQQVGAGHPTGPTSALGWWDSVITQAGLFFKYLGAWFWPATAGMSIDVRIDFASGVSPGRSFVKLAAFVAAGVTGVCLLRRRGRTGAVGFGLLFAWLLYLVEFSTVRFQEPFALYRSYLWGPGLAIVLAAVLSALGSRATLAVFAIVAPFLFHQARDRLETFSSPVALWQDAVDKLPPHPVPLGSRVRYNLARERMYTGEAGKALQEIERCLEAYPQNFGCIYARGAIRHHVGLLEDALVDFERAAALEPGNGIVQHRIGLTLEKLGRLEPARERYGRAQSLGYRGGEIELGRLTGSRPTRASDGSGRRP